MSTGTKVYGIESYRLHLLNRYKETISDGEGIRYSIYLAGCSHRCPGCHNVASWNPMAGILVTDAILADIIKEIRENPLLDGITISGGDPFFNPEGLHALLSILKTETELNIWCYTGYTLEQIEADQTLSKSLQHIDVLVDGRFVEEEFDPTLLFRGSRNQRILRLASRHRPTINKPQANKVVTNSTTRSICTQNLPMGIQRKKHHHP